MIEGTFTQVNLEYFLLILVRIASFVFVATVFWDKQHSPADKTSLSIFISFIVYAILPKEMPEYVR
jgi:flagellar biosynthetic protein FliR